MAEGSQIAPKLKHDRFFCQSPVLRGKEREGKGIEAPKLGYSCMKLDLSCKGCPNCNNKKVAQGTQIAPLHRSNMIVDVLSMVYLFVEDPEFWQLFVEARSGFKVHEMPRLQHKVLHSSNMTGFLSQVDQCSEGKGKEGKEPPAQLGNFWIKLDSR